MKPSALIKFWLHKKDKFGMYYDVLFYVDTHRGDILEYRLNRNVLKPELMIKVKEIGAATPGGMNNAKVSYIKGDETKMNEKIDEICESGRVREINRF